MITTRLLRISMAFALATAGFADTITLKNGQVLHGTFLGGTARQIRVDLGDEVQNIDVGDISNIAFGGGAPRMSERIPPPPPPPPRQERMEPPQQMSGPLGITLPAG